MATLTRRPTGDDAQTNTWTQTPSDTTYWDRVEEVTADDGDYITATDDAGGRCTFTFTAFTVPAGSTINSVTVYFREQAPGGPSNVAGVIKVGGTYYQATGRDGSAVWTEQNDAWTTNPKTSSAWTVDEVNGDDGTNDLEAFGVGSNDSKPNTHYSQVWCVVDYTEGGEDLVKIEGSTEQVSEGVIHKKAILRAEGSTQQLSEASLRPRDMSRIEDATQQLSEGTLFPRVMARIEGATQQISAGLLRLQDMVRIEGATQQIVAGLSHLRSMSKIEGTTLQISTALSKVSGMVRIQGATQQISESVSYLKTLLRFSNTTQQVSEAINRLMDMVRVETSTEEIDESTLRSRTMFRIKNLTQQIVAGIEQHRAISHLVGSTIQVATDVVDQLFTTILKIIDNTIQLSESSLRPRVMVRIENATQQISAGLARLMDMVRIENATQQLSESISHLRAITKVEDAIQQITESVLRFKDIVRISSSTVQISTAKLYLKSITRIVSNTIQITASALSPRALTRIIDSTIQITTGIVRTLGATGSTLVEIIGSAMQLSDSNLHKKAIARVQNASVNVAEVVLRAKSIVKIIDSVIRVVSGIISDVDVLIGGEPVLPPGANKPIVTYTAIESGGYAYGGGTSYYQSQQFAHPDNAGVITYEDYIYVGQAYDYYAPAEKGVYWSHRGYLAFDTTDWQEGGQYLEGVTLRISKSFLYPSTLPFDIFVFMSSGSDFLWTPELTSGDVYTCCPYHVASIPWQHIRDSGVITVALPSGYLNSNGYTCISLISNEELVDSNPPGTGGINDVYEYVGFYDAEVGYEVVPKLILQFAGPSHNLGWLRLIDMSLTYYLINEVANDSTYNGLLTVVDGYPTQETDIPTRPCVAVQHSLTTPQPLEIGHKNYIMTVPYAIDIFARSKGDRDEIAEWVEEKLRNRFVNILDWNVSDYNPPIKSKMWIDDVTGSNFEPMMVLPGIVDKYHAVLVFSAEAVVQ